MSTAAADPQADANREDRDVGLGFASRLALTRGRRGLATRRAGLVTAASQAGTAGAGALSAVALARYLGPSGRGGYALLQTIASLVSTLTLLGVPTLIVRRRLLRDRSVVIPAAVGAALLAALSAATAISVIYSIFGRSALAAGGVTKLALAFGVLYSVGLVLREAAAAHYQSSQQFNGLAIRRLAWSVVPLVATVGCAYTLGRTTQDIFASVVVMGLVTTVALSSDALRRFGLQWIIRRPWYHARKLASAASSDAQVRTAIGSQVVFLLLLFVYRLDVLVLGICSTAREVGLYSVGYAMAELAWLLANGYAITLLPQLVGVRGSHRSFLRRPTVESIVVAIAIVTFFVFAGRPLISHLIGPSYAKSYVAFLALIPGIVAFVPFKLALTSQIARGSTGPLVWICLGLVPVNICLNIALDPQFGSVGSAAASSVTYCLGAFAVIWSQERA